MHRAKPLLLVEDSPDDARILQRALEDMEGTATITRVCSAEEALTYLRDPIRERPALVLLDLHLPGMNGTEFLRAVKDDPALAPIPVVVLTTSRQQRDILQSFDCRAAGYIVKPFDYTAAMEALKIIESYWSLSYLPTCHT